MLEACLLVDHRSAKLRHVVAGVGLKHLTGDVKKMMSKVLAIDQNHYPEMLGHTVIINAPSVFKMLFGFIKPMLDSRTQAKIEVPPCCLASLHAPAASDNCMRHHQPATPMHSSPITSPRPKRMHHVCMCAALQQLN